MPAFDMDAIPLEVVTGGAEEHANDKPQPTPEAPRRSLFKELSSPRKEHKQKPPPPVKKPLPDVGVGSPAINLESLALGPELDAALAVKKLLRTVPRRKPSRQEWFRVHPVHRIATAVVMVKDAGSDVYLVNRELWNELGGELVQVEIALAINRQGVVLLWPIRLPAADGRVDEWGRSALEAANEARKVWVRMTANMALGAYELHTVADLSEPTWPNEEFGEIVRIAFANHYIASSDHPVLRRLRGEL